MTEVKTREAVSVFASHRDEVFAAYDVELVIDEKLIGGIPKDAKIVQGWLRSKAGVTEERELAQFAARTMREQGVDLGVSPADLQAMNPDQIYDLLDHVAEGYSAEKSTTGFKQDENGLYVEDRQVKAMLKEGINILYAGERWGRTKKGPKSFFTERVFVKPRRIHLGVMAPDGVETFVGHVSDKQGPRSTLGLHEFVEQPTLNFRLEVLHDEIKHDVWPSLWLHAENNGLGALRSQGFGTFTTTKFERVN